MDGPPVVTGGTTPYLAASGVYFTRDGDLYFVPTPGGAFGTPVRLDSLVSGTAAEGYPVVSADELEIAFRRSGDVYVASRATSGAAFGPATFVPAASTTSDEMPVGFSSDRCRLYFAQRSGSEYLLHVSERTR